MLKQKNLKIATAESCTGGLVSACITAVSGASQVFELGVTSYSNRQKAQALNVSEQTLAKFGAVSEQTAKEMALGVRLLSGADIGISVTGVAGPTSQEGHPVGTVFIGYSDEKTTVATLLKLAPKDRNFVRSQAVFELFDTTISNIKNQH